MGAHLTSTAPSSGRLPRAIALVLALHACCAETQLKLEARTEAESGGDPEIARRAARARLGRFEQALQSGDLRRVRAFFSDALRARQSQEETRQLVSSIWRDDGVPRWVQVCSPGDGGCAKTRHSAGWLAREAAAVVAIDVDRAGHVSAFQRYAYQCRAHTGCWCVYLDER